MGIGSVIIDMSRHAQISAFLRVESSVLFEFCGGNYGF